jgi:hypothetical protein
MSDRLVGAAIMRRWFLAAAALLFVGPSASAEDDVLLRLPPGLASQDVLRVVADAFAKRAWTVETVAGSGVVGRIEHNNVAATMEIYRDGDVLRHRDLDVRSAASAGPPGGQRARVWRKSETPDRWINFLRGDIQEAITLLTLSGRSAVESDTKSPSERLSALKRITEDEYAAKRRQILDDL